MHSHILKHLWGSVFVRDEGGGGSKLFLKYLSLEMVEVVSTAFKNI